MFKFFPDEKDESKDLEENVEVDKKELRPCGEIEVKQVHYDISAKLPVSLLKNAPLQLKHIRVADLLSSSYVKGHPEVKSILGSTSDLSSGEYEGEKLKYLADCYDLPPKFSHVKTYALSNETTLIRRKQKLLTEESKKCSQWQFLAIIPLWEDNWPTLSLCGGGFKIWECTFDLLTYLEEHSDEISIGPETKVLDLGCGSGLLGLYALAKGATVIFQDYNAEVLDFLTIPNTIANFGDEGLSKCRYYSGEWGSFHHLIEKGRDVQGPKEFIFDYILSSETIYNTDYLPNFISLVKSCLKPSGSMFLAAKTCYFGVGGGTKMFTSLIEKDSYLNSETVKVIRDGIQREILQVRSKIRT